MSEWKRDDWCGPYRESFEGSVSIRHRLLQKPERLSDTEQFNLLVNLQIDGEEAEVALDNLKVMQLTLEVPETTGEGMTDEEMELTMGYDPYQGAKGHDTEKLSREERTVEIKELQSWVDSLLEKETYQKSLFAVMQLECRMDSLYIQRFEEWMKLGNRVSPDDLHDSKADGSETSDSANVVTFEGLYLDLGSVIDIIAATSAKQITVPKEYQNLHCRLTNIQLKCVEARSQLREFETKLPGIAPLNYHHYYERNIAEPTGPKIGFKRKPAPLRDSVSRGRDDTGKGVLRSIVPCDPLVNPRPVPSQHLPLAPSTPPRRRRSLDQDTPRPERFPRARDTPVPSIEMECNEPETPRQAGRGLHSTPRHFHESGDYATGARNPFSRPAIKYSDDESDINKEICDMLKDIEDIRATQSNAR